MLTESSSPWRHLVGVVSAVLLAVVALPLLAWSTLLFIVAAIQNFGAGSVGLGLGGVALCGAAPAVAIFAWQHWSRRGLAWDRIVRRVAAVSLAAVYVTWIVAFASVAL